jgi:hypothetical protein
VVDEIRLAPIVVEAESELWVFRRHRVGAGPRHEPHEGAELRYERKRVEDQCDEQPGHLANKGGQSFEHAADAVEEQDQREDPQKDQQAPLVVFEHIRARRDESSGRQFTPTT